ncbi:MAG: lytic transglycosylase domain-containing protein [Acetobacteraceae bacterium]|nr:lytic transglycosylase domain-containing protein [Acetobacteraceae bacterium]
MRSWLLAAPVFVCVSFVCVSFVCASLCSASRALAQPSATVPALMRAGQWAQADTAAAGYADPVARKLVVYERLVTPGAAKAGEIAAFLREPGTWPRSALLRSFDAALAGETDDAAVIALCDERRPGHVPARLRCASAFLHAGRAADAASLVRETWIEATLDAEQEAQFLRNWGAGITPGDQWARFEHLAWTDKGAPGSAASRQAARLAPTDKAAAAARLALLRDDRAAPALLAKLSPAARQDPGLVLALLRWLRRTGQAVAAADLWVSAGASAERAAPEDRRGLFWREREALARELLGSDDGSRALAVAGGGIPSPDSEFLAGWIALQRLDRPDEAVLRFTALAALSPAAITQGRALYWLGRARAALGDAAGAQAAYDGAAKWLTTFYGQLAGRLVAGDDAALAGRLRAQRDPAWDVPRTASFAGQDATRAALLLVAWGEPGRARAFLAALAAETPDAAGWALAAHLALGLAMPDEAVAIARQAGLHGVMLPEAGWPAPFQPPEEQLDPAVALGVMRQESSFDPDATSSSGARGLMQLMPATAVTVAHALGDPEKLPPLSDPRFNMQLGTAYLAELLAQFQGALPVALAAYNAGPSRAQAWLAARSPATLDIVDWIELIPFDETRNYVQRCVEGITLYEARESGRFGDPLAPWLG